jgi:hypothetical protein
MESVNTQAKGIRSCSYAGNGVPRLAVPVEADGGQGHACTSICMRRVHQPASASLPGMSVAALPYVSDDGM